MRSNALNPFDSSESFPFLSVSHIRRAGKRDHTIFMEGSYGFLSKMRK